MKPSRILPGFVNAAVHNRQGLALWFLPEKNELNALVAERQDIMAVNHFSEISDLQGFVFAPFFQHQQFSTIFLGNGKLLKGMDEIAQQGQHPDYMPESVLPGNFHEYTRSEYITRCRAVIQSIKSGKAEKAVLSRIKKVPGKRHPAEILLQTKSQYPGAFCYLFYTPQTGMWLGATPETLLTAQSGIFKTMALAGTRPRRTDTDPDRPWPVKEQKEQNYVTGFIENELKKLGISEMMISEPYTSPAGTVEHIRTDFVFKPSKTGVNTGSIISALHPTPAVCGQPRQRALSIIKETEQHDRAYYTGFLGPMNRQGQTALFVNLRCMTVLGNEHILFAGGGITAESDPEAEWEETGMKASILEKVLRND